MPPEVDLRLLHGRFKAIMIEKGLRSSALFFFNYPGYFVKYAG